MVSLRPLTESNRAAVEALRVSPRQEQFVAGVADSLLEAVDEPDGRAIYWAVYDDETPVGFVMISDEVGASGVEVMSTSAGRGDGSPIPFYEGYGFVQTGELVFDGEVLLRLDLRPL